jgi:hypothetical protein
MDFYNRGGVVLLKLSVSTPGGGTVTVDPPNGPYLNGSLAQATATPAPGWKLLQWLGDATGTNQSLTVDVNRNKYLAAIFGTPLSTAPLINVSPQSDYYPYGTPVRLTAVPPTGLYFLSWSGAATGADNPLRLTVTQASQSISCQFAPLYPGQFALTVIEDGTGTLLINPRANSYSSGQTVTLTAAPDPGQDFLGWSGAASGAQNPLTVTMSSNMIITATFTKRPSLRAGTPLEGLVEDGFRITLTGEFGTNYAVLGSTNLSHWTPVGTVTNTCGTVQFIDPAATNLPARFYRALSVGPWTGRCSASTASRTGFSGRGRKSPETLTRRAPLNQRQSWPVKVKGSVPEF